MLIAITGATGFLGRYLVRHLAAAGHRLRCWYGPASDRTGLDGSTAIDWLPGQLGDPVATDDLTRGVDAVIHSALHWKGSGGVRSEGFDNLQEFLQFNLLGSIRLFEAAHRARVPRFVFISSCAVHEVILDDRPLDETHPLWPMSHYGAHKAALEKFVHSFGFGLRWPLCALRPTGIYGLAHPVERSRWFDLVAQVLRGESIASAKGGKEVHAEDVARAAELLLNAEPQAVAGQVFNCYDRYVAEQDVARIVKDLTGSSNSIAITNRGPKHQIVTSKLCALGMKFGGAPLLRQTIAQLVEAQSRGVAIRRPY